MCFPHTVWRLGVEDLWGDSKWLGTWSSCSVWPYLHTAFLSPCYHCLKDGCFYWLPKSKQNACKMLSPKFRFHRNSILTNKIFSWQIIIKLAENKCVMHYFGGLSSSKMLAVNRGRGKRPLGLVWGKCPKRKGILCLIVHQCASSKMSLPAVSTAQQLSGVG